MESNEAQPAQEQPAVKAKPEQDLKVCPVCKAPFQRGAAFCSRCGAALLPGGAVPEAVLRGRAGLRIQQGTLNVKELVALVEAGRGWWQDQLDSNSGLVQREQAVAALRDLSRLYDQLARQMDEGTRTIRVTTRLASERPVLIPCRVCGRANRTQARFCMFCGGKLPMHAPRELPVRLVIATLTDTGRRREINEDRYLVRTWEAPDGARVTVALVADGMGGAQAGEVASAGACAQLWDGLIARLEPGLPRTDKVWQGLLQDTVRQVNRRLFIQAQSPSLRGMGTTLTVAVVVGNRVHLAHVGDSRAYLLNPAGVTDEGATIRQLSTDHTLVARLVDIGQLTPEQARSHPQRSMIYRALATDSAVEADTASYTIQPEDRLLLCSDGISTMLTDAEIQHIVLQTPDPEQACNRMVALANDRGGWDNMTVVLIQVMRP